MLDFQRIHYLIFQRFHGIEQKYGKTLGYFRNLWSFFTTVKYRNNEKIASINCNTIGACISVMKKTFNFLKTFTGNSHIINNYWNFTTNMAMNFRIQYGEDC